MDNQEGIAMTDRREFIRTSLLAAASLVAAPVLANPAIKDLELTKDMKKIMIIDGGPRRNMNTAAMVEAFAEGARSAGAEVKHVRLYDIDYKGCRSCMACQLKGKRVDSCRFKDGIADILAECAAADGLVLASPIYFGEVTAQLRAFWERLVFPWLSYSKGGLNAPKKMPVTFIYTMNAPTSYGDQMRRSSLAQFEGVLSGALGHEPEAVMACNTVQVSDYSRFDFAEGTSENKRAYRDAHWQEDLAKAREAGKRMAQA